MRSIVIPLAIVVAGAILAGAVYVYFRASAPAAPAANPSQMRPVSTDDHILGDPAAPVVFVEYSDLDSPFSQNFDATMEEAMATYGGKGQVAWVYRHLPVTNQYPNAEAAAEASECAASLGGDRAFFAFIDAMRAATGTSKPDVGSYGAIASSIGLDPDALSKCVSAHTYASRVASDGKNALSAGAAGAPYTIVLRAGQAPLAINGAIPLAEVAQIIAAAPAQ